MDYIGQDQRQTGFFECGGVTDADVHPASIVCYIIDAEGLILSNHLP